MNKKSDRAGCFKKHLIFKIDTMGPIVNTIQFRIIQVNNRNVYLAEAGNPVHPAILFLHGYPENNLVFEEVAAYLKDQFYLVAIDLPGIGRSEEIEKSDTLSIAKFMKDLIETLDLKKVVLAGHDIGGMITYTFLKHFPERLSKAVIMNTAVPGVEPWNDVKRNPYIWHFALYAVPSLPEILITGKQNVLFDYFFDILSAKKNTIPEYKRTLYTQAYEKASSLTTSFNWYRAFPQDEEINADKSVADIPVLYLKGDKDFGDIDQYIEGFKKSGLSNIRGQLIPDCGHFSLDEQPEKVAEIIQHFILSN